MKEAEDTVNALAICLGVIGGVFLLLLTFYLVRKYFFDPTRYFSYLYSYRREFGSPSSTNKEGDMGVREYEAHGNGGNGYDRQVAQRVDQC